MSNAIEHSTRRNLYIPDALWDRLVRAAANMGARVGRPVSVSEYLRLAAEERLKRDKA